MGLKYDLLVMVKNKFRGEKTVELNIHEGLKGGKVHLHKKIFSIAALLCKGNDPRKQVLTCYS